MRPGAAVWVGLIAALACAVHATPAGTAPGTRGAPAAARDPGGDALWATMAGQIAAIDARGDGVLGVAVIDLLGGRRFALRGDQEFAVASTIKLAVLLELYRQSEAAAGARACRLQDRYTLRGADVIDGSPILAGLWGTRMGDGSSSGPSLPSLSNRDLALFMTVASDNTATNVLIDRVGMAAVNALCDRLGLAHTRLRRRMLDAAAVRAGRDNTSTPLELARLVQAIQEGQVIGAAATADLMSILRQPKAGYFAAALPEEVALASKPGSVDGIRAEAGIVEVAGRPFVLAVIIGYARDGLLAERAITDVAAVVYRTFRTLAEHSPYGRRLPP